MNVFKMFLIFFSLFTIICCRSLDTEFDKSDMDDAEYETDDSEDKEELDNDRMAEEKGDQKRGINEEQLTDFSGNTYLQRLAEERSARANPDPKIANNHKRHNLVESDENVDNTKIKLHNKMGMFNKYINKFTEPKSGEKKGLQEVNDYYSILENNNNQGVKNVDQATSSSQKMYDSLDDSNESYRKGYRRQSDINNNRDKRNINEQRNDLKDKLNNDDVSTIKEHIKRLSINEFNDLIHALSDSNIELLKTIFDYDDHIHINKRDITKKAGAVADSILTNDNHLDFTDKGHDDAVSVINVATTESTKVIEKKNINQEDSEDISVTEPEILTNNPITEVLKTSSDQSSENETLTNQNKINSELASNIKLNPQALVEDYENTYPHLSLDYPNYFQNDLTKLVDYKYEESNNNKREITNNIKNLKDSFSNLNNDLNTPLVRVKRRNLNGLKKKHDIESNIKNNKNKESFGGYENVCNEVIEDQRYSKSKVTSDNSNIGSDTDNVEGIDENLMLNRSVDSQNSFEDYSEETDDTANDKLSMQKQYSNGK